MAKIHGFQTSLKTHKISDKPTVNETKSQALYSVQIMLPTSNDLLGVYEVDIYECIREKTGTPVLGKAREKYVCLTATSSFPRGSLRTTKVRPRCLQVLFVIFVISLIYYFMECNRKIKNPIFL